MKAFTEIKHRNSQLFCCATTDNTICIFRLVCRLKAGSTGAVKLIGENEYKIVRAEKDLFAHRVKGSRAMMESPFKYVALLIDEVIL